MIFANTSDDQALAEAIVFVLYWFWRVLCLLPVPALLVLNGLALAWIVFNLIRRS